MEYCPQCHRDTLVLQYSIQDIDMYTCTNGNCGADLEVSSKD